MLEQERGGGSVSEEDGDGRAKHVARPKNLDFTLVMPI